MNRKQFLINEIANLVLSRLNEDLGPDDYDNAEQESDTTPNFSPVFEASEAISSAVIDLENAYHYYTQGLNDKAYSFAFDAKNVLEDKLVDMNLPVPKPANAPQIYRSGTETNISKDLQDLVNTINHHYIDMRDLITGDVPDRIPTSMEEDIEYTLKQSYLVADMFLHKISSLTTPRSSRSSK